MGLSEKRNPCFAFWFFAGAQKMEHLVLPRDPGKTSWWSHTSKLLREPASGHPLRIRCWDGFAILIVVLLPKVMPEAYQEGTHCFSKFAYRKTTFRIPITWKLPQVLYLVSEEAMEIELLILLSISSHPKGKGGTGLALIISSQLWKQNTNFYLERVAHCIDFLAYVIPNNKIWLYDYIHRLRLYFYFLLF